MKKHMVLLLTMIASSLISPVFASQNNMHQQQTNKRANACFENIDSHRYDFFLDLVDCKIQDNDLPFVVSYLEENRGIKVVFLDENNIGPEGAKLLAKEVATDFIGLDDNHIGPEGAAALAQSKSIYGFSLANNAIGTSGALALAKSSTIDMLTVSNNGIQPEGITALANNPNFKLMLGVAKNTLDAASVAALVNNKNLKGIDVSYTNFGLDDVAALLDRPELETLYINGLHLGDRVTKVLAQKKTILFLDVAENDLTAEGAAAIANFLPEDFMDLNISYNPIGDRGIAALVKANIPQYVYLSVEGDNISDEGAYALGNATIDMFDLVISHNHLTAAGIKALEDSSYIHYFDASDNDANQIQSAQSAKYTKTKLAKINSYCTNKVDQKCLTYLRKHTKSKVS